ncbi:MAG: hypothetical protein RLY97_1748 [Pseudomonadota bacterium]
MGTRFTLVKRGPLADDGGDGKGKWGDGTIETNSSENIMQEFTYDAIYMT